MAIVSAPSALMTQTAAALLAAAEELGLPADVVETTGDTPLGLGFQVPDEVFDRWAKKSERPGKKATLEPEAPAEPEPEEDTTETETPRKRGPGKPVTDGPEV